MKLHLIYINLIDTLFAIFFLQSRKTVKIRIINILKKFDTHMVYMLNSNQGRKWKKYVKIKTIRAGIDMGVSPRLRHKFSCINAWSSYFESDARSLSAPWAIYSIFIVNSLQTQAFLWSCGGKPRLEKRLRLIHSLLWVLRLTSPLV